MNWFVWLVHLNKLVKTSDSWIHQVLIRSEAGIDSAVTDTKIISVLQTNPAV